MAASDYLENELLDHVLGQGARDFVSPVNLYVALATASFGDDNSGTGELSGGSYARQSVVFGAAAGGSASNTADLTFTGVTGVADPNPGISHVGVFDAVTGGNLLLHGAVGVTKNIPDGEDALIRAGQLVATID